MRLAYAAVFLTFASAAVAQTQPPHTFTVTTEEANLILNKLAEMPWKDSNPLLQKLIKQLDDQNKTPAKPGE